MAKEEKDKTAFDVKAVEKEWAKDNVTDEMVKGVHPEFRLTKKIDDPMGITRISAGGDLINGQYLVYKGELPVVKLILENCLRVVLAKMAASAEKPTSKIITNING